MVQKSTFEPAHEALIHEVLIQWWRLKRDSANVRTRQSLCFSHYTQFTIWASTWAVTAYCIVEHCNAYEYFFGIQISRHIHKHYNAKLQNLSWAFKFVTVSKPHVLAQMSIVVPFMRVDEGYGESAHSLNLVWTSVTVQKFHVSAQMVIYWYFVGTVKALASLHICIDLP